jgi:cobalt/nickel transport protein
MVSRFSRTVWVLGISLFLYLPLSHSHEYWLDPIDSSFGEGNKAIVDIRNGQDFSGASFPYDSAIHKTIQIKSMSNAIVYSGRLGDYPAIHHTPTTIGLHSISLDTVEAYIVYDSWNKFSGFLNYHGLEQIKERHLLRQLPLTDIKERYFRSAKTFFQVNGDNTPNRKVSNKENQSVLEPVGSMFEMSLLNNPYGDIDEISLQLHFGGSPLPARQVEMFWKGSHQLRLTTKTDINGVATFKLLGNGDYMLNSVQLVEPEKQGVHWVSYWASVTFER